MTRIEADAVLSSHRKDLEAIFAPLVTDILRLIDDQIKSIQIKRPTQGVTVRATTDIH